VCCITSLCGGLSVTKYSGKIKIKIGALIICQSFYRKPKPPVMPGIDG
jgi:hypothetical protein